MGLTPFWSRPLSGQSTNFSFNHFRRRLPLGPSMPLNCVSVWNITEPIVEMRLLEAREKAEEIYNSYEINVFIRVHFYSFIQIYTDVSKDPIDQKVDIGVYIPRFNQSESIRFSQI